LKNVYNMYEQCGTNQAMSRSNAIIKPNAAMISLMMWTFGGALASLYKTRYLI
jgi:hypothetical protein